MERLVRFVLCGDHIKYDMIGISHVRGCKDKKKEVQVINSDVIYVHVFVNDNMKDVN